MSTAMDLASNDPNDRRDRLYALLPSIHRIRDAELGYPLQALLRVIGEQVERVEDDIAQLYRNWFIETADDWAVPYLAELLGYASASVPGTRDDPALRRVLIPRRDVAHLIRSRRRKGTVALLETLARDVAGWPAHAVEGFRTLDRAQHLDHRHLQRLGTAPLRDAGALERIGTPFDRFAHSVDLRRASSARGAGCHNIPDVAVFVWRMRSYPVTRTPASCIEQVGAHCFTFSVLGQDAPLYRRAHAAADAAEPALPTPLGRRELAARLDQEYGPAGSLAIWAEQWAGHDPSQPLPASVLRVADLGDWRYTPARGQVAVDPQRGRLMFPPGQLPKKGVRVSYHYGFAADLGGGEYARTQLRASAEEVAFDAQPAPSAEATVVYRVGEATALPRIGDALRRWQQDAPRHAAIELCHSGVWVEPLHIRLQPQQTLSLRAADGTRPVIRLIDWQTDLPDALTVEVDAGSRFVLDGVMVSGRPLHITSPRDPGLHAAAAAQVPDCAAEVIIRHCTLVPGWSLECDCAPQRPAEPSLELHRLKARVRIERSIVGAIQVQQDEVGSDPLPLHIGDSIVDACAPQRQAIGGSGSGIAHAELTVLRSTVFGLVEVHALRLAENSLFNDCLNVARRQIGCLRFCRVPRHCRTPRRYRCQPDQAIAAVRDLQLPPVQEAARVAGEQRRLTPHYDARRYGHPGYARLSRDSAEELRRGADDGAELGVYHHLYAAQREANLRARLHDSTPAATSVGLFFAD
ncbi:hypothetical protein [Xanthomonas sp. SS]|uniref:hypothetical protein n=1 Tax=Xanthomonas sp. SS TaxID=2724122 RepID=UPI0021035C20|nr:hypothetical protein [Xanthomonas sp. SS]